jgi:hypothetical protein
LMHATAVTVANSREDIIPQLVEAVIALTMDGDGSDTLSLSVLASFVGYCAYHFMQKSSGSVSYHLSRTIKKALSGSSATNTIRDLVSRRKSEDRSLPRRIEASASPMRAETNSESSSTAILDKVTQRFPGNMYLVGDIPVEHMFTKAGFTQSPKMENAILRESADGKTMASMGGHIYHVRGKFIGMNKKHPLYKNKETVGYTTQDLHKNGYGTVRRLYLEE